jgi:tricorn protease
MPIRLLTCLGFCLSLAAQDQPRFVTRPDVHGDQVVFTWDGDLWTGSLRGGEARRITTHPGIESFARFSPDGKWIAFTGQYDGPGDVYVMPAAGGTPKRLTWHGPAQVQGWTADGKILFTASYEGNFRPISRLYAVDMEGHEPEPLLPRAVQGNASPDGKYLAFAPKGIIEYYWKRYKGGWHEELWMKDLATGQFTQLTDYVGENADPLWAGGKLLFVSDRVKGHANLFAMDPVTKATEPLTDFRDFDVQQPGTDGQTVVFQQAGYLTALDLATKKTWRVDLRCAADGWKVAPRTVNPKEWIQSMALGDHGKTAVFEARGDVFTVPIARAAEAQDLTRTPGVRERMPRLSPDASKVAYFSDASGDYDIYVQPAKGGAAKRVPTGLKTALYHLEWSPDGQKLLFGDKSFAIYAMDLATGRVTKIDERHELKNDQFTWEVSDYAWAPDSTWIAYSLVEPNRNSRIYLYNLATKQKVTLTDGFYDSLNPRFDPKGGALYFLAYNNFDIQLDPSQDNHIEPAPTRIMAVRLKAGDADADDKAPFRIDADGLPGRARALPIKPGNYFHLQAGKGLIGWDESEGWDDRINEEVWKTGGTPKWKAHFYDTAEHKESVLNDAVSGWTFDDEGTRILVQKGGDFFAGDAAEAMSSKALPKAVDLSGMSMAVDPRAEWKQVFEDAWRWYRDFFYDTNMNGMDWQAMHDRYAAWLPSLNSRAELNWLLSQMVGELSVSHTYISGGDMGPVKPEPPLLYTGLLGADFDTANGRYRFTRVYGPSLPAPALKGPLADPDPKVKPGDYLLAIDGHPLKAGDSIEALLQVRKGQKVKLTVNGTPSEAGARTLDVEPVRSEGDLRYQAWVSDNVAKVDKLSNGQLGYMHISAMSDVNIGEFDKFWRAFRYKKGIVIDVRGNGGGWTEYFMIDKLERVQAGFNVLRGMAPFRYPGTASDGRFVFLSNEMNGSDGEAFLSHVKARKLGAIVGVNSWGGLVGIINTQRTVDGGSVEQSNNAFYGREGKWWVENHGVDPDLRVVNDPASLDAGSDLQLETGVKTLLDQLAAQPTTAFPPVPAYPDRNPDK